MKIQKHYKNIKNIPEISQYAPLATLDPDLLENPYLHMGLNHEDLSIKPLEEIQIIMQPLGSTQYPNETRPELDPQF